MVSKPHASATGSPAHVLSGHAGSSFLLSMRLDDCWSCATMMPSRSSAPPMMLWDTRNWLAHRNTAIHPSTLLHPALLTWCMWKIPLVSVVPANTPWELLGGPALGKATVTACAVDEATTPKVGWLPSLATVKCSGVAMLNANSACRKRLSTAASSKDSARGSRQVLEYKEVVGRERCDSLLCGEGKGKHQKCPVLLLSQCWDPPVWGGLLYEGWKPEVLSGIRSGSRVREWG